VSIIHSFLLHIFYFFCVFHCVKVTALMGERLFLAACQGYVLCGVFVMFGKMKFLFLLDPYRAVVVSFHFSVYHRARFMREFQMF